MYWKNVTIYFIKQLYPGKNWFQVFLLHKELNWIELELRILDIKMANLWPYKNHHFKTKYTTVLLQKHFEMALFKSDHPV